MSSKKNPKRELHPAEQKDGNYDSTINGQDCEQQIRSKTGVDGVEEVHITYVPRKKSSFMAPLGKLWDKIFGKGE